jgi:hypothetical protein
MLGPSNCRSSGCRFIFARIVGSSVFAVALLASSTLPLASAIEFALAVSKYAIILPSTPSPRR